MDTSEDNDWKRFSLTVKHNRKRKKNTKTLIFDLSHVIQPMQIQFVVTHDKQRLEEFLGKQGASLSDCSHGNITLSLESSGTVDEVGVQATNLIIHFLLEYDTTPFYLSEDEAEQKYAMKEQIGKVCLALNVNVIWKEESNIIWLIGSSTAVKKCFLSLMTFCQGTSEKAQAISQATFVDWEKCKQSAQAAVTESEGTISKQKHRVELLAVEDRHKRFLEETEKKHKEEIQKLTEEIQHMKKNEDELKTAFEATKSEQDKLKILAAADKDKFEAKLEASEKENAQLKEKISQLESDKRVERQITLCAICMTDVTYPKKLKCGHTFCRDCIDVQFQYKPVCPSCGAVYGKIIEDQPQSTMKVTTAEYGPLQGYEGCGIIRINCNFPPDKRGNFTSTSEEIRPSIMIGVRNKNVFQQVLGNHIKFDENSTFKIITIALQQIEEAAHRLRQFASLGINENHFASSNNQLQDQDETFVNIQTKKLDISEENSLALQFFCEGEIWMKNVISNGKGELEICDNQEEVTFIINSKIKALSLMSKMKTPLNSMEQSMTHTAIADVQDNVPGVLCYQLRDDKDKFLRLMGDNYNTLQQANHRISLVFGRIKQSGTRKNRRFETRPIADTVQKDNDNESTTTRTSSFYGSTSPDQSTSIFATREGLVVRIYAGSILHLDADCIVNAANENLQHGGGIAFVIARAAGYEFDRESRDYVNQNGSLAVGECCTTTAGDLKYKGVIHTVGPRWYDYPNDQIGCLDDLTQAVKAVMIECDYQQFTKVAIPAISSGIFGVPRDLCAQQYYRAVTEYSAQDWDGSSSLKEVHFVDKDQGMVDLIARTFFENCKKDRKMKRTVLSGFGQTVKESENCCICMDDVTDPKKLKCGHTLCRDCIYMQFQYKPVCPTCGAVYGKIIGDQPPGTMKVTTSKYGSLQGYERCGIIKISYNFPPGEERQDHTLPGRSYEGISTAAYLPNNKRGRLVCELLKIAFDRKLVFTIGLSRVTAGEGVITWNNIQHKTRMDGGPARSGYPDPTYLDRVMKQLEINGITEDSLNDP